MRRDEVNGFVMSEEDDLVEESMCDAAEIARQAQLIDMKSERRKLEREEEEANSRTRDELSNSGMPSSDAAELGNGNTPGLVSQKKSCYGKDSD